jgi:hypothetical protein
MNALRVTTFLVVYLILLAVALPLSDNVLPVACRYVQIGPVSAQLPECTLCNRGFCDPYTWLCFNRHNYYGWCKNCWYPDGDIFCSGCGFA